MRGQHPEPLEERAILEGVRRDGVEPPIPEGGWVTATWARQCPADAGEVDSGQWMVDSQNEEQASAFLWLSTTHYPLSTSLARVGVEPTEHEGLSFAALPDCVPRHVSVLDGI